VRPALATWLAVAVVSRYASLASIVAAVCAPGYAYLMSVQASAVLALVLIGALIVWRHKGNIRTLPPRGAQDRDKENQASSPRDPIADKS